MAFTKTNAYFLTNFTPYTLTLTSPIDGTTGRQTGDQGMNVWTSNTPYASIPPGGDSWFSLISETDIFGDPIAGNWASCECNYDFTDVNGGKHCCMYSVQNSGNVWVVSMDQAADGTYVGSTEVFEITTSLGPHQSWTGHEACTILSKPAEVTIDAGQDPAAATSVMASLWPQGTDRDYTPTTGVSYTPNSPWARGSAMVVNGTSGDVSLTMEAGDSTSETTSLSETLAWSTSLSFLGFANQKLSASVSAGQTWQQSVSLSSSESMTIPAGQQGWLQWCTTSAQVTGDCTFTWTPSSAWVTPAGITYHVNNVTITQPGYDEGAVTWEPYAEAIPASPASFRGMSVKATLMPPLEFAVGDSATVIDANTDPGDAGTAMALWSNATNKQFTATTNPMYSATQPKIVSSRYEVPASWKTPESFSFNSTQSSSSGLSLGGSVGAETTLGVIGFANASVSIQFTASHEWDTGSSDSQTIQFEIPPGHIGWVTGSTGQVTYTGDFAFTANGTDYVVKNVTITNPGSPDCGPKAAFTYYAVVEELSPSVAKTLTRPGIAAEAPAPSGSAEVPHQAREREQQEHGQSRRH